MKCQKCKKKMLERQQGAGPWLHGGNFYCQNRSCYFFGILRIDFKIYDKEMEE